MEKSNKKLKIIVIILMVLVLILGGYIVYDKVLSNENQNQADHDNETENEGNKIDESTLNNLYSIIGILPEDQYNTNDCLNISISNNNYKDNFKSIFSWYALLNNMNTYHSEDPKCQSSEQCKIAYSCAACISISKNDANKIIRLYNFDNDMDGFLNDMPEYDDEYSYSSHTNHPSFCEYNVEHNTHSEYINSTDIKITDNQTITEYEFASDYVEENIKSTKTQIVVYEFKKDIDGNYYLYNVEVK